MSYIIVFVLILFSALFSGLTLGFFSLNANDLKRKAKLGDARAKKIYKVRKNGNLLLCTLLVGNVAINSALSIFLGTIASGVIAGVVATTLIVIFGEIVPQAAFSRYALVLGSKFVWVVQIFTVLFFVVCWPIAKMLDKVLGDELGVTYSRQELVALMEEHEKSERSEIDAEETRILKGTLTYSKKKVKDIATPKSKIFAIPASKKITKKALESIYQTGHSRIPVYQKNLNNIVGVLYVKDLIRGKTGTAQAIARTDVFFVEESKTLDDLLEAFKQTRCHLFIVEDKKEATVGLVTIEDVIEEIIGAEIIDEYDRSVSVKKVTKGITRSKKS